ncbi:hypothetical protein YC2023_018180 [Brassica napus]
MAQTEEGAVNGGKFEMMVEVQDMSIVDKHDRLCGDSSYNFLKMVDEFRNVAEAVASRKKEERNRHMK